VQSQTGIDTPDIEYQLEDPEYKKDVAGAAQLIVGVIDQMWEAAARGDMSRLEDLQLATEAVEGGGTVTGNPDAETLEFGIDVVVPKIAKTYSVDVVDVMEDVKAALAVYNQQRLMEIAENSPDGFEQIH
jgi:hypothetical protein